MKIKLNLLSLGCGLAAPTVHAVTNPVVACAITTLCASVTDPIKLAFAPDGALTVSRINNFPGVMTNGASFTLLTAPDPSGLTGAFANVASGGTLTTTDGYARFTVRYAGETTTNLVDPGLGLGVPARYYRIRLGP